MTVRAMQRHRRLPEFIAAREREMDPLEKRVEANWYLRMRNEAVARERER